MRHQGKLKGEEEKEHRIRNWILHMADKGAEGCLLSRFILCISHQVSASSQQIKKHERNLLEQKTFDLIYLF
uniref:Uncharacterized protein n=1 Tax=Arundo donax TaxID=35708 RepID=A0A0A9DIK1_ARUDO